MILPGCGSRVPNPTMRHAPRWRRRDRVPAARSGRGLGADVGDRRRVRLDLRRAVGLRRGRGARPPHRRPLRLGGRGDGDRGAAVPHGDEHGCGGRRGRARGPGGHAGRGARATPVHPHQAVPHGLGARPGSRRDVLRGDRGAPVQPAGEPGRRGEGDRVPARLDPGLGRQRRGSRLRPGGASRRRSSTPSSTTGTTDPSTHPRGITRSSAGRWSCAHFAARSPIRRPAARWPSGRSSGSTSTTTTTSP